MNQRQQQLIYHDKCYTVISIEQDYVIHPSVFFREKLKELMDEEFHCVYRIQNGQLTINDYFNTRYSGAILIGRDPIKEYPLQENSLPCYSYRTVYELVFNHGLLVTTADQSKAMLRIRRNLELGYRSLMIKRDSRCIRKYINSCFIGDYRPLSERKKRKMIREMKNLYPNEEK